MKLSNFPLVFITAITFGFTGIGAAESKANDDGLDTEWLLSQLKEALGEATFDKDVSTVNYDGRDLIVVVPRVSDENPQGTKFIITELIIQQVSEGKIALFEDGIARCPKGEASYMSLAYKMPNKGLYYGLWDSDYDFSVSSFINLGLKGDASRYKSLISKEVESCPLDDWWLKYAKTYAEDPVRGPIITQINEILSEQNKLWVTGDYAKIEENRSNFADSTESKDPDVLQAWRTVIVELAELAMEQGGIPEQLRQDFRNTNPSEDSDETGQAIYLLLDQLIKKPAVDSIMSTLDAHLSEIPEGAPIVVLVKEPRDQLLLKRLKGE